jgi:hypothetical protein
LIGAAPAPPIADDGKIEGFLGGLDIGNIHGKKATGERGLGRDEEGADKIAAGERHGAFLDRIYKINRILKAGRLTEWNSCGNRSIKIE